MDQSEKQTYDLMQDLYVNKDNIGCYAAAELIKRSQKTPDVYPYMENFFHMLDHKNSYIRNRALYLIASNSKWDFENKINQNFEKILQHAIDEKPITARQCIQSLAELLQNKPELVEKAITFLDKIDFSVYKDSMSPLLKKDIIDLKIKIDKKNNFF